jgi:hypothetical protein
MLATIVYAINPKSDTPEEGFTSYSNSPINALKKRDILERDIKSNTYKSWTGQWRKDFINRCKANGWEIRVSTVMIG